MKKHLFIFALIIFSVVQSAFAADYIVVPMDDAQRDHLRAYGLTYFVLNSSEKAEWLLNYRGGSFLFEYSEVFINKARIMGVSTEVVDSKKLDSIFDIIETENMERIILEKPPKLAVYTPDWAAPWDDAVTLALTYAEIPFDKIWDKEVLAGDLKKYDWLHLHHEDFTGQFSRFWVSHRNKVWYIKQVKLFNELAAEAGYASVREHKGAVARMIQKYVADGGFLFTMCSGTETLDIALALYGVDFIPPQIDGTPIDNDWESKIKYSHTFAFIDFIVNTKPTFNPFSDIDYNWVNTMIKKPVTDFELFNFSAKVDPVPTMLNQNHTHVIEGFYGLTTSFRRSRIKKSVTILGETPETESVRYIHGNFGQGSFTFYGGHDPEDQSHYVLDLPTDLSLHKNSPGYRLILNNLLFPAAKKEKKKT